MIAFVFWNGSNPDDIRALGLGAHAHRYEFYPLGGEMLAVVIFSHHPDARKSIDALHPNLVVFPGPNGKLSKRHADHISKLFPQAKSGDAFSGVLADLYAQWGTEVFNPDAY